MTLRAYLDDVSVTGSPLDVSATLADISALAAEIHLDLNWGNCAWWPGLRPNVTNTPPTLLPLNRPEGLSLLSVPFGKGIFVQKEIDRLLARQATLSEELVSFACKDPHVAVILQRFCVGPRLNYCLRSLPLYLGGASGGQK